MRVLFLFFALSIVYAQTGVQAIDSMPVYDWDIPTSRNSLPITLGSALLFPGGGQFYTGHYVRGGFLFAFEAALIYECGFNKKRQFKAFDNNIDELRKEINGLKRNIFVIDNSIDSIIKFNPEDSLSVAQLERQRNAYKTERGGYEMEYDEQDSKKRAAKDLLNSELAWLAGLHIYGLFDAYGIWRNNNNRNTEQHNVSSAVLWAMIPGFGQIYNNEWGKAGLLYLGLFGSSVSLWSRQQMVDYHRERLVNARENPEFYPDSSLIKEDILFFRKKRNQYIWAIALFYIYSIADAAVDAMLHDFDSSAYFVFSPLLDRRGRGIQAEAVFNF